MEVNISTKKNAPNWFTYFKKSPCSISALQSIPYLYHKFLLNVNPWSHFFCVLPIVGQYICILFFPQKNTKQLKIYTFVTKLLSSSSFFYVTKLLSKGVYPFIIANLQPYSMDLLRDYLDWGGRERE